jgi:general secretion pathway protein J
VASKRSAGFTLIEVVIALAITAFVSVIAYASISSVMTGVDRLRENTTRTAEVNRALMIISRDLRQFVVRPVRDEFGDVEPAMTGGEVARFALSFTRTGWHNPNGLPRSNLERVNYRIEDNALWRDSYPVLDRISNAEPNTVLLLDHVDEFHLLFLGSLDKLQVKSGSTDVDTSNWMDNWVADSGAQSASLSPPVAIEMVFQLPLWGEVRRMYALPPL